MERVEAVGLKDTEECLAAARPLAFTVTIAVLISVESKARIKAALIVIATETVFRICSSPFQK
jgi:hypothetical protein